MSVLDRLRAAKYRSSLGIFVLVGVMTLFIALSIGNAFWQDAVRGFAVAVIAVAGIQLMWDFVGGSGADQRIEALQQMTSEMRQDLSLQGRQLALTRVGTDITTNNVGLVRIWANRRAWLADPTDGLEAWYGRIERAHTVMMLSNTLENNWLGRRDFVEILQRLMHTANVKLVIYHPDDQSLFARAMQEGPAPGAADSHARMQRSDMRNEILRALEAVRPLVQPLGDASGPGVWLGLSHTATHAAQIIRADDEMLVSPYLTGKTGSPCPVFQLRGHDTAYFKTYEEQFDLLWKASLHVGPAELEEITRGSPAPRGRTGTSKRPVAHP